VAQATFSLILELCNHTGQHNLAVKSGDWTQSPDFCFWQKPLIELAGKTFGIVGYGNIGQAVIRIAQAFGMKTIVHTRTEYASPLVEFVDKKTLFENSDIISLHCPLTDKTDKLVDEYHLSLMKKDAYIINTSRGALIDENALAHALNNDRIAGAGLDVLGLEPPSEDNPLLKAKNTIITPHVAWATHSARKRLIEISYNNLISFLNGQPINCLTQ
jgi:glycerate dehydrogenase